MESELCRCCLGTDRLQCMAECCVEYNKSYVEMLNECFNINICECRPWICIICIAKLTDAYNFHSQVCKSEQYLNPTTETIRIFKTEVDVKHDPGSTEEDVHREEDNHDSLDTDMEMDNLPLSRYRKLGKDEFLNEIGENNLTACETNNESTKLKAGNIVLFEKKQSINELKDINFSKKSINNVKPKNKLNITKEVIIKTSIVDNVSKSDPHVTKPRELFKCDSFKSETLPNKLARKNMSWAEYMVDELESLERDCMDYYLFSRLASKYICAVCKESYADIDEFKTHTRQHSHKETEKVLRQAKIWRLKVDISSMKCRHCNGPVTELDDFRSHLSFAHEIESRDLFCRMTPFNLKKDEIKCVICKKVFINLLNLTKHMNQHNTNCVCSYCGHSFVTAMKLKAHIKRSHLTGTFRCIQCDEIFETIAKRDYHTSYIHGDSTKLCPHCPEKLPSYHAKMVHLAKVHNEELKKYKCQKCPKKFVTSSSLSSHNRYVHLQERNYPCSECSNAFFRKKDLDRHMIKHTGERKYGCEFCGKAYARRDNLRHHMKVHNDEDKK